jgi:threonyl-tRNA synthetase
MKYKIRDAQTRQVPYMLVVGEREQSSMSAAIRHRRKGDLGALPLDALVAKLKEETATRALDG